MKKQLPLYILLVFLIIVNGFFLFKYMGKPDRKGPKGPEHFVEKKLNFSEAQTEQYRKLFSEHRKAMGTIDDKIRGSKDAFFDAISKTEIESSKIDSMASAIANLEKQKDLELFRHFRKVYNVCNDEQKENFQELVKRAVTGRRHKRNKRH